jgi:hypothetical protein
MCEFVFLNHVNICGRILQLTPKNGTNLAIFELTKKTHRLNQFPKVILTQKTAVLVLVFGWRDSESRQGIWHDSCFQMSYGKIGVGCSVARLLHELRHVS